MNPVLSCCNPSTSEFHQLTAKPLHFNDAIGEQSVHCERDRFIQRVRNREAEPIQLASSSCNKTSPFILSGEATISSFLSNFQTFRNASYTFLYGIASYIARAARSEVRWLQCCRCPFHLDTKLDKSKLLMASNCLAENTAIPVLKALAYSTDDNYGLFSTYISSSIILTAEAQTTGILFYRLNGNEYAAIRVFSSFTIQNTYYSQHRCLRSANSYANMLLDIGSLLCVSSKEITVVMDATGSPGKQSALLTLLGHISNVPRARPNASIIAFGAAISIVLTWL
ncbi:hypothetical protein X797_005645 [Metarhizium robertsii]|uniref:Uncharacterized protein n=1 Tax=Metarhizium robertsii TaxID=568076 RepID=A0A014N497_9HYPO|nr:hypothetical protein X797_005645 [Metarhizium robertsii]